MTTLIVLAVLLWVGCLGLMVACGEDERRNG